MLTMRLPWITCLFFSILCNLPPVAGKTYVIHIQDQPAFDQLGPSILKAVDSGEREILVDIGSGVYRFHENHIDLRQKQWGDVCITIRGKDARLIGDGYDGMFRQEEFRTDVCYLDGRLEKLDFSTRTERARSAVHVFGDKGRLDTGDRKLNQGRCSGVYIRITQWFTSRLYPVLRIDRGVVTFEAKDLRRFGMFYEPNADLYYGKQVPRYRLYNLPLAETPSVHACEATCFLYLAGCRFSSFTVEGLSFLGNASGKTLVDFYHCKSGIYRIVNCQFRNLLSHAVYMSGTSDVTLEKNLFTGCERNVVHADMDSKHARILANRFVKNGTAGEQTFNIVCRGEDFLVKDNYLEDYGYSAIGLGLHYSTPAGPRVTGVVEKNEICLSEEGFLNAPREGLMDSGAIYVWTQTHGVTIRDNLIHDINGPSGNRGIFCDDGTNHVTIVRNTIRRVANSYAIDIRRVASVETLPDSRVSKTNLGNRVEGNRVEGKIRFEER